MSRAAVFFDRDGIVNELVPDPQTGLPESPLAPEDVRLAPGAADALRRLGDAGFALVGVSNQPAAAKGTVPLAQLHAVATRVVELLAAEGVVPDDVRYCFHHPEGVDPELGVACDCRKPAPGLLTAAAAELGLDLDASWLIGDTDADALAGLAAGCSAVLVEVPGRAHKRVAATPDAVRRVGDMEAAATIVLARTKG